MARGPHLPLRPIAVRDRASILFLEYGQVDVIDGAFVLVDQQGVRVQIPVGGLACLMLEPGIRITLAAVALAARVGCLLVWVGEGAVRLYSAGQPGGARADRLLYQARCALDDTARLNVVREMFRVRFACRDLFRKTRLLDRIIPSIQSILAASGIDPPDDAPEAQPPSFATETSGDDGHRG